MLPLTYVLTFAAAAYAQAPPSPVLLTSIQSGVNPIVPTPFSGVETLEGAIIYDGPPVPGFTGPGGNATAQTGLSAAQYTAVLPATNFDNLTGSTITGSISGVSTAGGTGVTFTINFSGFPSEAEYGPFVYHIHALPVPANGNCTATLGHLDPTDRGELYACDVANPQSCQAGDLAGKHGNITSTSFTATYTDPYLSTQAGSPYFFGDKSIVIHSTNTTRLTCANFARVSNGGGGNGNSTSASGIASTGGAGGATSTGAPGAGTPTSSTVPEVTTNAGTLLQCGSNAATGFVVLLALALSFY